ncbi:hypothetical protein GYMLUDRAFT_73683 [Collybiopsis luxurians FD-317 M1]|uniref:rRNA-processing protein EFG1 n=1 Tax=Collybiopsis luxurians FD-317 M1 TaxID=944289 RepID=A0A0D0CPQ0_9AGAR|nr:hypothetical protein GYMLUDRAFT_73683 [Collybiopsis luxurians FD-317 M1]
MGPIRSSKRRSLPEPSETLPGIQKIKASIRQTKRLLAKEKLTADVRVTAERKLKSLEADLAKAETNRKEKTLSIRYHKVKFFERQKVTRKINQTKRKISQLQEEDEGSSSAITVLEKELYEHRVELNYILHYPKTKKYISLFPPEVRHKSDTSDNTNAPETKETDQQRQEIKQWIREQMSAGSLPAEPEDVEQSPEQKPTPMNSKSGTEWPGNAKKKTKTKESEKDKKREKEAEEEEEDDFFE